LRIFMSVEIPNASGNEAIKNGALPRTMKNFMEKCRPEGAFFITNTEGNRCAHFYFDMKDVSQMVVIAEPFFMELGAKVVWCPAMTPPDLEKGITEAMGAKAGAAH